MEKIGMFAKCHEKVRKKAKILEDGWLWKTFTLFCFLFLS